LKVEVKFGKKVSLASNFSKKIVRTNKVALFWESAQTRKSARSLDRLRKWRESCM